MRVHHDDGAALRVVRLDRLGQGELHPVLDLPVDRGDHVFAGHGRAVAVLPERDRMAVRVDLQDLLAGASGELCLILVLQPDTPRPSTLTTPSTWGAVAPFG